MDSFTHSETHTSSFRRSLSIHISTLSEDQHVYERPLRAWLQTQGHTILAAPGDPLTKKLRAAQDCDLCLALLGPEFGRTSYTKSAGFGRSGTVAPIKAYALSS